MKKTIILIFLLQLISCTNKKKEIKIYNHQLNQHLKETDSVNGYDYVYYFKKTENPYKKGNVLYKLDSLVLYQKGKKYILNLTTKNICSETIEGNVYTNQDFNFDGNNDIMIFPYRELPFNYRGYHFLYNPKNKKFDEQQQLDSIYNEELCANSKMLYSIYEKPTSELSYLKKYHWINNALKDIEWIEEKKLADGFYQIKSTNIEKNETKEFKSKRSIISNFHCR